MGETANGPYWTSGGEIVPVAVPVAELGPLPPVPARDTAEVLGDPGEAVDLPGPALRAGLQESPGGGPTEGAGGEFGGTFLIDFGGIFE